jgi:hypothetical protein
MADKKLAEESDVAAQQQGNQIKGDAPHNCPHPPRTNSRNSFAILTNEGAWMYIMWPDSK